MSNARYILIPALAAALLAAPVAARPPRIGSKAYQLMLKQALDKKLQGTLRAALNRNRQAWQGMTPEQRRVLRDSLNLYLNEDRARQADLLKACDDWQNLSPDQREQYRRRAAWLKKVVASLTQQQRQALSQLSPEQRAKRLLELKARLVDRQPTTRPAESDATAPASTR